MTIRYEIEENTNAVKIFYDDNTDPALYQLNKSNGDPWVNKEDAEEWAKSYIVLMEKVQVINKKMQVVQEELNGLYNEFNLAN
jgi:hypothetical protein